MKKLIFDCTPFLVNRTAVHRMVRDMCGYFEKKDEGHLFRYSLEKHSSFSISSRSSSRALRQFFFGINRPTILILFSTIAMVISRFFVKPRRKRVFYFDPIYTLFHWDLDNSIVMVLDLTPVTVPEWHSPNISRLYFEAYKRLAASSCKIISISESTTRDLRVNFGVAPERISTIGLYLPEFVIDNSAKIEPVVESVLAEKFILFVGSMEKRKNGHRLARAFAESGLSEQGYHLVFAGGRALGTEELEDIVMQCKNIHLLGYVSDNALRSLYANALAFAYVSCWEGFGVPLLEAMARGLPCLSPTSGASPEVGRDAVIYIDPCDQISIRNGLIKIVNLSSDERSRIVEKGYKIAKEYSFESFIGRLEKSIFDWETQI